MQPLSLYQFSTNYSIEPPALPVGVCVKVKVSVSVSVCVKVKVRVSVQN